MKVAHLGYLGNGGTAVNRFQFQLVCLDRIELRNTGSHAFCELNRLGAEGWHLVHVRDDPQHGRDLMFFLEREVTAQGIAGTSASNGERIGRPAEGQGP